MTLQVSIYIVNTTNAKLDLNLCIDLIQRLMNIEQWLAWLDFGEAYAIIELMIRDGLLMEKSGVTITTIKKNITK